MDTSLAGKLFAIFFWQLPELSRSFSWLQGVSIFSLCHYTESKQCDCLTWPHGLYLTVLEQKKPRILFVCVMIYATLPLDRVSSYKREYLISHIWQEMVYLSSLVVSYKVQFHEPVASYTDPQLKSVKLPIHNPCISRKGAMKMFFVKS